MKRFFDLSLAIAAIVMLLIPIALIALIVKSTSIGPVLYWSSRVGKNNKIFHMAKFRSMRSETPALATHLLDNPSTYLTPIGGLLRKTSIDELPQLWSIFKGDMSFVGPRPALYNQDDLVALRSRQGVDQMLPGLTGWAQVNGRDEVSIEDKVALDLYYLKNQNFWLDIKILWLTLIKVVRREGVSH